MNFENPPLAAEPPAGKVCTHCGKPGLFAKNKSAPDGLQLWCKACQKLKMADYYKRNKLVVRERCDRYRKLHVEQYRAYSANAASAKPELRMWICSRSRAKRKGIPFNIEVSDIVIPERCPLLGIELCRGTGSVGRNSPTLDRRDPKLGYVKGNVWVISHKANAIKQDATLAELELLVSNLRHTMAVDRGDLS